MSCNTCFEDYLVQCNSDVNVNAQLAPLSDYTWIITDKFDKQYSGEFTTDTDGFWQIPADDLPDGFLTQFSGTFKLQVQDASCKPVKFKIAQEYDCISFALKGGTRVKDTIGCDFSCTPAAGQQTQLQNFTNASTVSIPWTPGLLAMFGNSPTVQVFHLVYGGTYQLVNVEVQQVYTDGVLTSIEINNGGPENGYVLLS